MPRRANGTDSGAPHLNHIAVSERRKRILGSGFRPEVDRRPGPVSELQMTGEKIGVEVRQKDVTDREVVVAGKRQVLIDVALRVDNRGRLRRFVADQVRRVRQAVEIELMQEHESDYRLPRSITFIMSTW